MNFCLSAKHKALWEKQKQKGSYAILTKASTVWELGRCTPLNYKEYVLICMGSTRGYQSH